MNDSFFGNYAEEPVVDIFPVDSPYNEEYDDRRSYCANSSLFRAQFSPLGNNIIGEDDYTVQRKHFQRSF